MDYHNDSGLQPEPQPRREKKYIAEIFSALREFYGHSLEDIASQAEDEEMIDKTALEASEMCAQTALLYFFLDYPKGDPIHDTFHFLFFLMGRAQDHGKDPNVLMITGITLDDAFEKLRQELKEKDNKIEDRVFDSKFKTYPGNEALCSIEFIGGYNTLRSKNGGNLREDVPVLEDFGFIFVPAEFYDKCMQEPLESLCDVIRVAYKAVAYSVGLYQKNESCIEEDADRLVRYFLDRIQQEDSIAETFMTDSLRALMEKYDGNDTGSLSFDIRGSLVQRSNNAN